MMAATRVQELLARIDATERAEPDVPIDFPAAISDFSEGELLELARAMAERSGMIPQGRAGKEERMASADQPAGPATDEG